MTLLAGNPIRLVNGEEASIMTGATIDPAQLKTAFTPSGDVILTGSYKSYAYTESASTPVDFAIALS